MNRHAKSNAIWTGIAALMMLYFGWGSSLVGTSENAFYNTTVDIFTWTLRVGGICLVVVSAVCLAGLRVGLLLDALASGITGLSFVLCAAYWLAAGGGFDINDLLILIFGGMFLKSARECWTAYAASAADVQAAAPTNRGWFGVKPLEPPKPPAKPEPPHPASIRPKSIPEGGEPPPGGYLAALAKEDEEPPTASFK